MRKYMVPQIEIKMFNDEILATASDTAMMDALQSWKTNNNAEIKTVKMADMLKFTF